MQSLHTSAELLAWAEQEGIDLSMLYERLQSDTPGKAGGVMSGAASKAVAPVTSIGDNT